VTVPLTGSALLRRALRAREEALAARERCELCGEPVAASHRHLLDMSTRGLLCACRACATLFDRREAGGAHYRLIPDRRREIANLELDEVAWAGLQVPVALAFFVVDGGGTRATGHFPGPMGVADGPLDAGAWEAIVERNPVLATLEDDVEALLARRSGTTASHWILPIDDCYALAGAIRTHWKGLGGGRAVKDEIERFLAALGARSRRVTRTGERA
jgi:hypothetical protein